MNSFDAVDEQDYDTDEEMRQKTQKLLKKIKLKPKHSESRYS